MPLSLLSRHAPPVICPCGALQGRKFNHFWLCEPRPSASWLFLRQAKKERRRAGRPRITQKKGKLPIAEADCFLRAKAGLSAVEQNAGAVLGGRRPRPGRRLGPGRRSLPKNRPILLPCLSRSTYSKIPKIKNAFHWLMKWQGSKTAE